MKTAIIKTTFWDDEDFEQLNLDSKLLYFYLLANPGRTLHKIIKFNDKIASAYTGLSIDQIQICKKQLESVGLIAFNGRYYILLKDYVEAKKGRFTSKVIDREDLEIPSEIKDYFESYNYEKSIYNMGNYTGTIPEHKDNDKDNNKTKEKTNSKTKEKEIPSELKIIALDILEVWNEAHDQSLTSTHGFSDNLEFWLKELGIEKIKNAIKNKKLSNSNFYRDMSISTLFRRSNKAGNCSYIEDLQSSSSQITDSLKLKPTFQQIEAIKLQEKFVASQNIKFND